MVGLLCLATAGCHLPLLHPIRLREGPYVGVSASTQVGDGVGGECGNPGGCMTTSGGGGGGLSFPQLSAGYAHLFTPNVGFLAGGTMFTMRDQRLDEWYALSSFVLFGVVQSDELAVGGGADFGAGAATLEAAAEATIWTFDALWDIGLAVFARRTIPYHESTIPSGPGFDFNPSAWSYEIGVRVPFGPLFVEYSYFRLDRGFVYYPVWETAGFSEGLHMITFGITADGRAFFEDRYR